jgi:diaminopimelate decarboxylase
VRRGLAVLALVWAGRRDFDTLDVGGGFPVGEPGTVPSPTRFAREMAPLLEAVPRARRPLRLAVEPGRFLVAQAGWLVASVLHVREREGADGSAVRIVVLDAGMTELIRPAMYGAWHRVTGLTSLGQPVDELVSPVPASPAPALGLAPARNLAPARVDGPVCESTDTFGTHDLPPLRRGDLVAIADAGAYAASMASTYNGRPAAPQVLLEADGRLVLGRRRGRVALGR